MFYKNRMLRAQKRAGPTALGPCFTDRKINDEHKRNVDVQLDVHGRPRGNMCLLLANKFLFAMFRKLVRPLASSCAVIYISTLSNRMSAHMCKDV